MKTYYYLQISMLFLFAGALSAETTTAASPEQTTFQRQHQRPANLEKDRNLYEVGYAHFDTQWRWTYPQVIQQFIADTMRQNFALIEEYPNYVFNFTGSRRYEFMKEYYPEDYEKVKKYVAAGRWFPAGSSVDESDVNVPSLESLVRQFLYGNGFFKREFGVQSQDFMLPDCFGFPASLPSILAHGGIKGFSTQKLMWGSAVGIPFNVGTWVGPDGTSVIAALNPGNYKGNVREDLSKSEKLLKRISDAGGKSGVYADYQYYGTGDHGGAPDEESVKWIERSLGGGGPVRVISSRSDQMFQDITPEKAAKLPTYKGDLLLVEHSAGSITSQAYMKRWNRKNELLANAAESAATTAFWLGAIPYPHEALYRAWDLVLGSQMHDMLPGTSVPKAYEYSWNDEVLALNQFASIAERSTAAVLSMLDTQVKGVPVAVYNPLSIEREDPVEATIPITGALPEAITAYDPQGLPVPTQILGREGDALRVLFLAKVPSVGCAIYDLRPGSGEAAKSALSITNNSLENARYRVTLDTNGDISSIFDKLLNRELLASPSRLSFHTEYPAMYPAWNMDWSDRQKPARGYVSGPAKIRVVESGPVRVALEVERTTENSKFVQHIRLATGSAGDRVEILDRIDWRSFGASLKADFSFTAGNPEASYDDKVGVVIRGNNTAKHYEVPQQQWMDLTAADGSYGVAILNDSKFGSDKPDDHTMRLTLLHTPEVHYGFEDQFQDQYTQDQGRHEILYALAAHSGDWIKGRASWQAARLNQPLRAFLPSSHPGPLGRTFSLLSLNSDQAMIVAVKKAEDSNEVIVRVKELTGKPASNLSLHFPAAVTGAQEVDGQERPMGKATMKDGLLVFDMKAFGIRAFSLKLAPPATPAAPVVSQPVTLAYDVDVVSSNAHRNDGAMDASGCTYPAELFPNRLASEGVEFHLGPTADGAKNALGAHGQHLDLPAGDFNRVHLLVAAEGDAEGQIKIGDAAKPFIVPNWTGFIGQWDNRLWDSPIAGYNGTQKTVGLVPGFIKRTPVVWYATHHHTPKGDAYYEFAYLFQLSYDLPHGTKSLTLPDNPKIRVFAVSASHEPSATPAAAPLYDTLADHQRDGVPSIPQAGNSYTGMTEITLLPTLYHRPGELHYTLDGSDPTATSPVYDGPFPGNDSLNIAVRQIDAQGQAGPIIRGTINIQDPAPPRLISALVVRTSNVLELGFSKPLSSATASDVKNFVVQPPLTLKQITPTTDRRVVAITFGTPLATNTSYSITMSGLKDNTRFGKVIEPTTQSFNAENVVYALKGAKLPGEHVKTQIAGLPLKNDAAWTMNLFVKPDSSPEDRTLIGGFGCYTDNPKNPGTGRYFAIFRNAICFWSANRIGRASSPLEVGRWQMFTATYDGKTLTIYKDAKPVATREGELAMDTEGNVIIGIPDPWDGKRTFQGQIQDFTIRLNALTADEVKNLLRTEHGRD